MRGWLVLLPAVTACASGRAITGDRGRAIDALFADYAGSAVSGASVIVIRDGRVVFRRAYGMADLEHRIPATPTNYRLASLTSSSRPWRSCCWCATAG
jgi:CubicO group peptidase (beta-lactamase class C family)